MILGPMHISLRHLTWCFFFFARGRWKEENNLVIHFPGYRTFGKVYNFSSYSDWLILWNEGAWTRVLSSHWEFSPEFIGIWLTKYKKMLNMTPIYIEQHLEDSSVKIWGASNSRMTKGASCYQCWNKGKFVDGINKVVTDC